MGLRNFDGDLFNMDGSVLQEVTKSSEGVVIPGPDGKAQFSKVTLRLAVAGALNSALEGEQNLPFDKKWERFKLSRKILNSKGPVELNTKEIELINHMATRVLPTFVFGQVIEALEQEISAPDKPA